MLKLNISYEKPTEIVKVMQILKPILKGAKIKHNDKRKPYLHTYITIKNSIKD